MQFSIWKGSIFLQWLQSRSRRCSKLLQFVPQKEFHRKEVDNNNNTITIECLIKYMAFIVIVGSFIVVVIFCYIISVIITSNHPLKITHNGTIAVNSFIFYVQGIMLKLCPLHLFLGIVWSLQYSILKEKKIIESLQIFLQ